MPPEHVSRVPSPRRTDTASKLTTHIIELPNYATGQIPTETL